MVVCFSSSGAESGISSVVLLSSTTASARSSQRLLSLKTLIPERKTWSGVTNPRQVAGSGYPQAVFQQAKRAPRGTCKMGFPLICWKT